MEQGQATVEFALAIPILCLLLIGTIQIGLMIWASMDLTTATRDGARRAAVARIDTETAPDQQVRNIVRNSLDFLSPDDVTIMIYGGWTRDSQVTVRTSIPYQLNIMGAVVWSGDLTAQSKVRIG